MRQTSKTIFITSFFGLIGRNILATDFLEILKKRNDLRVVVLAPQQKVELYKKEFESENVTVEGIKLKKPTKLEQVFTILFCHLSDTSAWRIHRLIYRKKRKKYHLSIIYWIISKLGKLYSIRKIARWLDYKLLPKDKFREYFEKYKPDIVFATDIFQENDIEIMREAKNRGVFLVGMVRSWDNITSKGLNRVIPDKLIVNTPKLKEEAITLNDIREDNIHIVGIPHYDSYLKDKRTPKNELFSKLGLDPNKKTIFFAPPSSIYAQDDSITKKAVKELLKIKNTQLLLRFYIVGDIDLGDVKPEFGKVAIDDPSATNFTEADLLEGDKHLADLLYYSNVVVAFASTLAIDAVLFNKPIIFIGFDGDDNRPLWKSLRRFYDYDHQKSVVKTGGVKLAKNMNELIDYVNIYLDNPREDEKGRNEIIKERIWKLDAKSGKRLAEVIIKYL